MDEKTYEYMNKRVCEYQSLNTILESMKSKKQEITGLTQRPLGELAISFDGTENANCFKIHRDQFEAIKKILIDKYNIKIAELEKEMEEI